MQYQLRIASIYAARLYLNVFKYRRGSHVGVLALLMCVTAGAWFFAFQSGAQLRRTQPSYLAYPVQQNRVP